MTIVKPNIQIPPDLKSLVVSFATVKGLKFFRKNTGGEHRRLCNLNDYPDLPVSKRVKAFAEHCYSQFDIPIINEPVFGNFIGVGTDGSFVQEHRDRGVDGLNHIRLNFLLSKPMAGGMPIIDGVEYSIEEDQCWFNFANLYRHGSTPIQGSKHRIVLSLGCLVSQNDLGKIKVDAVI